MERVTSAFEYEGLQMNVRFYGRLADLLGEQMKLDMADCSIGQLRAAIADRHPLARAEILSQRVRACVHDVIAGEDHLVGAGGTVEFFPPVSGG
ncbi:MoaD/ThiS family protein [Sphingomonas sp. BN140010]|uniref:MoaD/ThiS family protein n=1 Tax=Sphingomonas arvum TaxID=2992113 RepID=A0ABT3JB87_9SPHN|nr:MoaD/ThiS family protein [Sphingomonas sp. BN140010]MCW3796325.1 MoaD/ThiS family protein [Sphingomonas sp. BN140010]